VPAFRMILRVLVLMGLPLFTLACEGSQDETELQKLAEVQQRQERNKDVVSRYFFEFLDGRGSMSLLDELFTEDCIIQRAELPGAVRGLAELRVFMEKTRSTMPQLRTSVQSLVAEGDYVFVHIRHKAVMNGTVTTSFGTRELHNLDVEWPAMSVFRLSEGKIAEQQVLRDELGILKQEGFF
jgi:predicted SnoaL-like aldol condensation-catalyzing enzyme